MKVLKQIRQVGKHNEFSWAEAFSDPNGKTSITAILVFSTTVIGLLLLIIGAIHYIYTKDSTIVNQGLGVTMGGTSGTVAKKIMEGKPQLEDIPASDDGSGSGNVESDGLG